MTDLSDYVESMIRDWMTQETDAPPAPSNIYVALHNGDPGDDGSTNEVSQSEYDRAETVAGADWNVIDDNEFENADNVNWGLIESDWGTISHVSLWDSETGGNCLGIMSLSTTVSPSEENELYASQGDLIFKLDETGGGGGGGASGYGTTYGTNYGG